VCRRDVLVTASARQSGLGSVESHIEAASGADVQIANHPSQDGAAAKLAALARRQPGDPHPLVIGNATTQRYLTMVRECAQAGLATSR